MTVQVSMTFRRRGSRKRVFTPEGQAGWAPAVPPIGSTVVKALARGYRWHRMLEEGRFSSIAELAAAERINSSYLSRVLRLTLLAPEIVEQILDGRSGLALGWVMGPFPVEWEGQADAAL